MIFSNDPRGLAHRVCEGCRRFPRFGATANCFFQSLYLGQRLFDLDLVQPCPTFRVVEGAHLRLLGTRQRIWVNVAWVRLAH